MVIGDFGPGLGDHRQQGALAHIGEADQTHIGDELQLQSDHPLFTGQAGLGKAGSLTGGGGKMAVAPATPAAFGRHKRLVPGHILKQRSGFRVPDQSAAGHFDEDVFAILAAAALAGAVGAVLGHIFPLHAEVQQGGEVVIRLKDNAAALAAIASIRPAGGDVFFPVKGDSAIAPFSRLDKDPCNINKHNCNPLLCASLHAYGGVRRLAAQALIL